MISSFLGLQTSLRGLLAQQQALDVAAHNVANANTVGYTRQEATLGAANPLHLTAGATQNGAGAFLGQGVDVTAYRRVRDSFLDLQVRAQNMALGDATTTAEALDHVQSAIGEPSTTGINALLGKFYTAWGDLANHPESDSSKQAVNAAAKTLADAFGSLANQLQSAATDASAEFDNITGASGPIKAAATSLAQLNKAIGTAVQAGQSPNDLLDRRDQILDDLSQYGQVSVSSLGDGKIQVMLGNQSVVNDTTVDWQTPPVAGFTPAGGVLGALKTLSTTTIPGYIASLDAVAKTIHDDVNTAYGSTFFTGSTAATLSTGILTASAITAGTGGSPATGSNDRATAVAALRDTGAATAQYGAIVRQVGADAAGAANAQSVAQAASDAAEDRRQNVSGVSLDEEMANMLRFQRGYQASARAMSTIDDMLDTLINRAGRVGL
ncbi:MAG TPA: flagellar hook-associated protein FlgK [Solirubrobacteraceae bacterium]|nr:flagellar hook-associated protein FlgK [Solirubrobacteraceae bacterium]